MNVLVILIVILSICLFVLLIKKARINNRFTQYIINNGGSEINFINNEDISSIESAKLLNKKYKIGFINSYIVVNSIRVTE
ncbi:hypothetical protein H353_08824 [Streptococcus oralis subsp. tigurinus 1366]|uniref:Uncharacterized protein n=1 Tax=Streptococcus oralis subsp. tigurinus 2426 TaxID=1333865 RepID=S9R8R5_STROR|nr:hypothetical protein H353_08824 [Streptococcus oralis subsp. tigurinus 1366]EPX88061.1 hypothetical protein L697_08720 [Streptococcus oralis subsp. tigurinus 2425]EPX88383.1 hypothetical protein L698_08450 [Streptococcus oralis subsp. tigurinus 2426]ORO50200.1 hypothetical protein B7724_00980 [Streptococcus oralis subsp. tigurinus]